MPTIPKHEGWRYGELIYRAMYAHQGGKWEAVEDHDRETVWYPAGYRLMLIRLTHTNAESH
jgi:hypothetical protein